MISAEDEEWPPIFCTDANGRRLAIFNPAVVKGGVPKNTDFTISEWRTVQQELGTGQSFRSRLLWLFLLAVTYAILVYCLLRASIMCVALLMIFTFPVWATVLMKFVVGPLSRRTWGELAFADQTESRIVRTLLKHNRCPSCAYRLSFATPDRRATCPECGAAWQKPKLAKTAKTVSPAPPE